MQDETDNPPERHAGTGKRVLLFGTAVYAVSMFLPAIERIFEPDAPIPGYEVAWLCLAFTFEAVADDPLWFFNNGFEDDSHKWGILAGAAVNICFLAGMIMIWIRRWSAQRFAVGVLSAAAVLATLIPWMDQLPLVAGASLNLPTVTLAERYSEWYLGYYVWTGSLWMMFGGAWLKVRHLQQWSD